MRAAEWVAALLGATVCLIGALLTAKAQVQASSLGTSPLQALWPLPALVLIDWAVLGLLGFGSVALGNIQGARAWGKMTWAICGALVVLMILGSYFMGPYVMWAALCFTLAGTLAWARQKPHVGADLLAFALGAFGNLTLLFFFALFGRH